MRAVWDSVWLSGQTLTTSAVVCLKKLWATDHNGNFGTSPCRWHARLNQLEIYLFVRKVN